MLWTRRDLNGGAFLAGSHGLCLGVGSGGNTLVILLGSEGAGVGRGLEGKGERDGRVKG